MAVEEKAVGLQRRGEEGFRQGLFGDLAVEVVAHVGVAKVGGMHHVDAEAEGAGAGRAATPAFVHVDEGAVLCEGEILEDGMVGGLRDGRGDVGHARVGTKQQGAAGLLGFLNQGQDAGAKGVRVGLQRVVV